MAVVFHNSLHFGGGRGVAQLCVCCLLSGIAAEADHANIRLHNPTRRFTLPHTLSVHFPFPFHPR